MDIDELYERLQKEARERDERLQREAHDRHEYSLMEMRVQSLNDKAELKDFIEEKLDPVKKRITTLEHWRTGLAAAWGTLATAFAAAATVMGMGLHKR